MINGFLKAITDGANGSIGNENMAILEGFGLVAIVIIALVAMAIDMRRYMHKKKEQLSMENHSRAYRGFHVQLSATGREKCDGYDPNLFYKLNDDEIEEVEEIVKTKFKEGDLDLAVLLPYLSNGEGIQLLKDKLNHFIPPTIQSARFAGLLLIGTGEKVYKDILVENLNIEDPNEKVIVIGYLKKYLSKWGYDDEVYKGLDTLRKNNESDLVRFHATLGMLISRGLLDEDDYASRVHPLRSLVMGLCNVDDEERKKAEIVLEDLCKEKKI